MNFRRLLAVACCLAPCARAAAPDRGAPERPLPLDQVTVTTDRYQPAPPADVPYFLVGLPRFGLGFDLTWGWPDQLAPVVVTAARTAQPVENVAATARLFDAEALLRSPAVTLDGALRSLPQFSLFRRSDSLTANPTAQGVSLRGLGPSGASRSLLLYDGVPLNDPFGGWIAWNKLPREGLLRLEVLPGGGASAWGNAALGGVIQAFAAPLRPVLTMIDRPPQPVAWGYRGTLRGAITLGALGTRSAELAVTTPAASEIVQLLGRTFVTAGHAVIAPERRGTIDVPAWNRHRWFQARWRHAFSEKLELLATARGFEELRGNGTPYTRNGTRERFLSTQLAGHPTPNASWTALAYWQDQSFASTFSSVNATRTAETPASDQFAVPAVSVGAAWTGAWQHAGNARTTGGADLRLVRGETREHFTFAGGRFTRQRVAGGRQDFLGLFATHERPLAATLRASAGGRLDLWRDTDGRRHETDRDTGTVLRSERYATQDDLEFSPSLGLVWKPAPAWRARASAQQAFRRPTLNELYRPFRQGANVTEANAALRTERVTSAETALEWTRWAKREIAVPSPTARPQSRSTQVAALSFSATAFWNDLHDAVGNVTIARGPGTFPIVGTLPAGGLGRQRLNLDRTRVRGLEFSARWSPYPGLTLTGDALFNDATVRRAVTAPALAGRQVAQVPRRSASAGAIWQAPGRITLSPRVRFLGRQFEDDENQLRLGAAVVADLQASRPLTPHLEIFVTVENLGDARLETGRGADGLVNVGTPRLWLAGLRGTW